MTLLTSENFKETLNQGKPVLVDFYADWCAPCRMQAPILDQVYEEVKDFAIVAKVDVEQERDLARQYGIMSIPTLIIFKDGQIFERISGLTQKQRLVELLKAAQ